MRQISEFMDVVIDWNMNIYVNNKLADMETKVYENFSVIWTMEELQLSDVEVYEQAKQEEERVREDRPAGTAGFSALASKATEQQAENGLNDTPIKEADASENDAENQTERDEAEAAESGEAAEEQKPKGARIVMGPGVKRAEEEAKAKAKAREEEAVRVKEEENKRREEILNKNVPVSIIVTVND